MVRLFATSLQKGLFTAEIAEYAEQYLKAFASFAFFAVSFRSELIRTFVKRSWTACTAQQKQGRQLPALTEVTPPGPQGVSQNCRGPAGQAVNGLAEVVQGAGSALSLR